MASFDAGHELAVTSQGLSSGEAAPPNDTQTTIQDHEEAIHTVTTQPPLSSRALSSTPPEVASEPPLPDEPLPPPLPDEPVPAHAATSTTAGPTGVESDDGWSPVWDPSANAYYFYNRFTQATQWDNPRVPSFPAAARTTVHGQVALATTSEELHPAVLGGYNPAIHGSYDPNADYAQPITAVQHDAVLAPETDVTGAPGVEAYGQTAGFNRYTGRYQVAALTPENFNDENKSKRQMNAFFDVDAAANSHNGRSLKAERAGKRLSKDEVKAFKEKRREKKEEKRRAWLRD